MYNTYMLSNLARTGSNKLFHDFRIQRTEHSQHIQNDSQQKTCDLWLIKILVHKSKQQ